MKYEPYTLADVKRESNKKKFTVISTFAGGGGSSIGYRLAGGDIRVINEFMPEAIATYSLNFPSTPIDNRDIKEISGQDLLDKAKLEVGECDILDGSPPCSAFSMNGKREKGWGDALKQYGQRKQSNIEDLFFQFIRVANEIQPKIIVAENVEGLTFGKSKEYLYQITNGFEAIGYHVTFKVLNAADYGVPQARKRSIFIAVRNDIVEAKHIRMSTLFPPKNKEFVSVREGVDGVVIDPTIGYYPLNDETGATVREMTEIEWLDWYSTSMEYDRHGNPVMATHIRDHDGWKRGDIKYKACGQCGNFCKNLGLTEKQKPATLFDTVHKCLGDTDGVYEKDEPAHKKGDFKLDGETGKPYHKPHSFMKPWLERMTPNPNKVVSATDKDYIAYNPKGSYFNLMRPAANLPSPTLTARGSDVSSSGTVHHELNRKYCTNELKRIMSLPEDYKLTGKFNLKVERIGRMVASKMMAAIAANLYEKVLR